MSVVQVTVQTSAGPAMLGAAAASVQLARSLGSALGTAAAAMALFVTLSVSGGDGATLLGSVLQEGPAVLDALEPARRSMVKSDFAQAFRAAFLVTAAFAPIAGILAWTIPLRRI
jgi:hypothetical protein